MKTSNFHLDHAESLLESALAARQLGDVWKTFDLLIDTLATTHRALQDTMNQVAETNDLAADTARRESCRANGINPD